MNKEKIEKIIEKWGTHTSEGGIYWNSHEEPHPLKGLVDELVTTIRREAVKEFVEYIQENIGYADLRGLSLLAYQEKYLKEKTNE